MFELRTSSDMMFVWTLVGKGSTEYGVANVGVIATAGRVANVTATKVNTSPNDYRLAILILASHPPCPKLIRYIKPYLRTLNQHHKYPDLSFHVMHPLDRLANASLVMDRECKARPIQKNISNVSTRGCKDQRRSSKGGQWYHYSSPNTY